ncbi:MAG TPA: response regulator transcription factor [Acidobacteriaceae bacterium]|nr:response regulator transcription factor [Acidobacteriaceae bacterium]
MTPVNDSLRVLLVDDDAAIRRALRTSLNELGFHTTEAARGEEAVHLVRSASFDIVLLDMQMPGMGGIKTLASLRTIAPRLPVLIITVQDSEEHKVEALDRGADDYIVKPFGVRECIARMRAVVRRARAPELAQDAPLQIGEILVQPSRRLVSKAGQPIHLTPKEYDILHFLMLNAGRAVTYGKLLSVVWGAEYRTEVDYLRTFVRQLRKKIEDDPSNPRYLLTDAYVGYRFAENLPAE